MGSVGPEMVLKAAVLYTDLEMAIEMCACVHAETIVRKEVEAINVQEEENLDHWTNTTAPPKAFLVVEEEPWVKSYLRMG